MSAISVTEEGALYRVAGVPVDVTAQSAVEAQETAIARGQTVAFRALLSKILPAEDVHSTALWSAEDFLDSFEFLSQKFSQRRFVATLAYTFSKPLLKEKLKSLGLRPAVTAVAPYVVIPVLATPQGAQLWEDDNPWLQAWGHDSSAASIVVPLGDLNDIVTLKVSDALELHALPLERFSNKYNAQGALVVVYRAPDLLIHVVQEGRIVPLEAVRAPLLDARKPDYTQLIPPVRQALEEYVKRRAVRPQKTQKLQVALQVASVREFLHVQNILKRTPAIDTVEVIKISDARADAILTLAGDLASVRFALQTHGLYLTQGQNGQWWISRTKTSSKF